MLGLLLGSGISPTGNQSMRIAILTNEYPPHIYGGAGVHVDYLSRELAQTIEA